MLGIRNPELSDYEKMRLKNIEENKKMLESLGLLRSFKPILQPVKKRAPVERKTPKQAVKRKFIETENLSVEKGYKRRRSLRKMGVEPDGSIILPEDDDEEEYKPKPKIKRENFFGAAEGIPVGTHWDTRMECSADSVHRPTVAGISGNETDGCFSIALSGGYEDDIDLGDSFTYTGSGGRDLKGTASNPKNLRTAPQSKDQTLTKMNLALSRNVDSREPVRVIRGYKCPSAFAPEYGYRYDGLYTVEKCWSAVGLSGFLVWKYILKRVEDQPPPPWIESDVKQVIDDNNNTEDIENNNADVLECNKENIPPNDEPNNENAENVDKLEESANGDISTGDNMESVDQMHENSMTSSISSCENNCGEETTVSDNTVEPSNVDGQSTVSDNHVERTNADDPGNNEIAIVGNIEDGVKENIEISDNCKTQENLGNPGVQDQQIDEVTEKLEKDEKRVDCLKDCEE